ncbi:MAG: hypothetical protein OXC81_05750 [Betaproteobacteria bacterium]|nr:hypothetical protein [Betaproteobacteria bacterium]
MWFIIVVLIWQFVFLNQQALYMKEIYRFATYADGCRNSTALFFAMGSLALLAVTFSWRGSLLRTIAGTKTVLVAALFALATISTGCGGGGSGGGGGGGGGSVPSPASPSVNPSPPANEVRVGQTDAGFGPEPFLARLNIPNRDDCDETGDISFLGLDGSDVCDMMQEGAQNFQAVGITGNHVAIVTTGVTALESGGNSYVARPASEYATIAVADQGFNPRQSPLADVLLNQYNFVASDIITIEMAQENALITRSQGNSRITNNFPSYYPLVTAGLSQPHSDALKAVFNEHFAHMFHGTGVAAVAAGKRISITLTASGVNGVAIESTPGMVPGAKILPINLFGAVSIKLCTAQKGSLCIQSRPHFIADTNFAPRLSTAIDIAGRNNAFVFNFGIGLSGISGQLTLANAAEFAITLTLVSGDSSLPNTIVTTFGVGAASLAEIMRPLAPDVLPAGDDRRKPASWPPATKKAITSGNGMAMTAPTMRMAHFTSGVYLQICGLPEEPIPANTRALPVLMSS